MRLQLTPRTLFQPPRTLFSAYDLPEMAAQTTISVPMVRIGGGGGKGGLVNAHGQRRWGGGGGGSVF